jgi:hypothetical protein
VTWDRTGRRGEKVPVCPYSALFIEASLQSGEVTIADVRSEQEEATSDGFGNDGLLDPGRDVPLMSEKLCGGRIVNDERGDEPGHGELPGKIAVQ